MPVVQGMIAGLLAGIVMGIISEVGYRLRIFQSSVFVIDGSFIMRFIKRDGNKVMIYLSGILVHLLTGTVFGGVYLSGAYMLKWNPLSPGILFLYCILLWLAMIFVALPMANQGLFGKKGGRFVWIQQLVLHIVYGAGLLLALTIV